MTNEEIFALKKQVQSWSKSKRDAEYARALTVFCLVTGMVILLLATSHYDQLSLEAGLLK